MRQEKNWHVGQLSSVQWRFLTGHNTVKDTKSHMWSAADVCFDSQPLYGLLQAKLQLITHAYFEEKDFSQISILKVRLWSSCRCFLFITWPDQLTCCCPLPLPLPLCRNCTTTWTALWGARLWRDHRFISVGEMFIWCGPSQSIDRSVFGYIVPFKCDRPNIGCLGTKTTQNKLI